MEELDVLESSNQYWQQQDGLLGEEELMIMGGYQLLDERTPAYAADYSKHQVDHDEETEGPRRRRETSMVNKLISTVYSGPTISDIESALSFTGGAGDHQLAVKYSSSPVVFSSEKVLSKMENKYTLKIKTCGNGLAEDGYKWRKYGQKSIKNSPNPRSYYRCTNPRCNAKKQVERAMDEPDTLLVTYEGLHLHYTYSHFLHSAQVQHQQGLPKKPKRGPANSSSLLLSSDHDEVLNTNTPPAASNGGGAGDAAVLPGVSVSEAAASAAWSCFDGGDEEQQHHHHHMEADMADKNGGLLEDVVPLLVRRPCGSTTTTGTGGSSQDNSPPSPSASSVPWTPTSPYIDMAILSNIF